MSIKKQVNPMLFRKEAIDETTSQSTGDVLIIPKIKHSILVVFILVWVSTVLVWLFTNNYSRKETVSGWVSSSTGVVRVFSPLNEGIVRQIYVSEGQTVSADEPLFLLNNSKTLFGGDDYNTKSSDGLKKRRASLEKQKIRIKNSIKNDKENLLQQQALTKLELKQIKGQLHTLSEHESVVADELKRYKTSFDKGSISLLEYNRVQKELLSTQSNKQSLARSQSLQRISIQKINSELEYLPIKRQDSLDSIDSRIADIDQESLSLESQYELIIKSPVAGKINNIQVNIGQRVDSRFPFLSVVSGKKDFSVNLLVPIRSAGFLKLGQSIDIRYNAFPYQKFGSYKAIITRIPDSVLLPDEIRNIPLDIREAVYMVEAELEKGEINAYGKAIKIKSDMTLSADIYLSQRTLFEWLLEPFYSLTGRIK